MQKSGAPRPTLVNTGWNGTGRRISIKDTRGIIDAILDGSILTAPPRPSPTSTLRCPPLFPVWTPAILDPLGHLRTPASGIPKSQGSGLSLCKELLKYAANEAGKALVAAGPRRSK